MPHSHLSVARHFVKKFGKLYVIVPCFNPLRFVSRYVLLKDFIHHASCAGAVLWVTEAAFGGRPWEVDVPPEATLTQLRTADETWVKEDIINVTVNRLPHDWEYVAWIDGDVKFLNPDWVHETVQQLQHYDVVQMFEHAFDLGPNGLPLGPTFTGFPASRIKGLAIPKSDYYYQGKAGYFHPGYAWACTRAAWETMGGLIDFNIVGGADHQMAHGFYGTAAQAIPVGSSAAYRKMVLAWQTRAMRLKQNVGFVPGTIAHYWHGKKARRGYFDRWRILVDNGFNPITDLSRNAYGLWELTWNKPKLRDDMRAYFRSRQEDGLEI